MCISVLDHDYDSGSHCSDMGVVDPRRSIDISLGSILFVDVILCLANKMGSMETISDE